MYAQIIRKNIGKYSIVVDTKNHSTLNQRLSFDFFWRGRLFVEQKVPKVILALSTNISPIFSTIELSYEHFPKATEKTLDLIAQVGNGLDVTVKYIDRSLHNLDCCC
jgi:hypothetical protein